MAVFSGDFETRRIQVNWEASSGVGIGEDLRVITFHAIKLSGGDPVDTWDSTDFTAAKDALAAFWESIKGNYQNWLVLKRIAFYREGPGLEPPLPPVHDQAYNVAGTIASGSNLPPQCALSVTEKSTAVTKLGWGRFYLPAPIANTNTVSVYGRPTSTWLGGIADAVDTLYEAFRTAGIPMVIYRPALPQRTRKRGGTLPARSATALTVDSVQIDNVYDVIRKRRWEDVSLRVQREISGT